MKAKKKWYKRWWAIILWIIVGLITISFILSDGNSNTISQELYEPYKDMTTSELKEQTIKDLSYDSLFRYNQNYIGKLVLYKGKIIQIIGSSEDWEYRIYVTREPNMFGDIWDDAIYVIYKGKERFLEEDIIELIGIVEGIQKYKSILGEIIEIPKIHAIYIALEPK